MIDSFFLAPSSRYLFLVAVLKEQTPAAKTAPVSKGTLTASEKQNVLLS